MRAMKTGLTISAGGGRGGFYRRASFGFKLYVWAILSNFLTLLLFPVPLLLFLDPRLLGLGLLLKLWNVSRWLLSKSLPSV